MEQLRNLSKNVPKHIKETYAIYEPLLRSYRCCGVAETSRREHQYGPHERHKLDVYEAKQTSQVATIDVAETTPILLFLYGGGMIDGDRIIPGVTDGLVYSNIGQFFATRCGFHTIIVDYRLVKHGSRFNDGGGAKDLDLALHWIQQQYGNGSSDVLRQVYLLGNSAGAVHIATWLFDLRFDSSRRRFVQGVDGLRLHKAVLLSGRYRLEDLKSFVTYYESEEAARENSPFELMRRRLEAVEPQEMCTFPSILDVFCELDYEQLVTESREFEALWTNKGGRGGLLCVQGHNHISPSCSLFTGIAEEEEWGYQIAEWLRFGHIREKVIQRAT